MSEPASPSYPTWWNPREGIGWARSNFLWGWTSGALFSDALLAIGGDDPFMGGLFLAGSLFALRMAKRAERPLFVSAQHIKDYEDPSHGR